VRSRQSLTGATIVLPPLVIPGKHVHVAHSSGPMPPSAPRPPSARSGARESLQSSKPRPSGAQLVGPPLSRACSITWNDALSRAISMPRASFTRCGGPKIRRLRFCSGCPARAEDSVVAAVTAVGSSALRHCVLPFTRTVEMYAAFGSPSSSASARVSESSEGLYAAPPSSVSTPSIELRLLSSTTSGARQYEPDASSDPAVASDSAVAAALAAAAPTATGAATARGSVVGDVGRQRNRGGIVTCRLASLSTPNTQSDRYRLPIPRLSSSAHRASAPTQPTGRARKSCACALEASRARAGETCARAAGRAALAGSGPMVTRGRLSSWNQLTRKRHARRSVTSGSGSILRVDIVVVLTRLIENSLDCH
jgi:hypothetical protein